MKYKPFFALALLCASLPAPASAKTTVIHAGHLIAEPGRPVTTNQSIIVENGKIVAIKDGFVPGDTIIDLKTSWVMPGLIDMHTHVTRVREPGGSGWDALTLTYLRPPAEVVLGMLPRMKTLLMGGFTTIRNLYDSSSTTYALRDAINSGAVIGPRMFATEPQIAVDGGDLDPGRKHIRLDLEYLVANRGNCTGVVECVQRVREEVRRGADVIKLRQSGLALDPKIAMVETPEEVRAIIATAHQLNRKVAAHVVGSPAYMHMVIEAGADTIEHGPLDDKAIALMKKHGTAYTPTLLAHRIIEYRVEDVSRFTGRAYRAGVPIVFGTDIGVFGPERSHEEFGLMAAAGMPPEQVLRAATLNAAVALGRGDSLGSIAPGKIADIIAMKGDPFAHIDHLGDASKISFVMKEGEVFKDER